METRLENVLGLGALCLFATYFCAGALDPAMVLWITAEDNVIESVGAYLWLAGAVVLFLDFRQHRRPTRLFGFTSQRNMYSLILAIVFFLAFGEEISWGQRALGITPPPVVTAYNAQQEITIHNLALFNPVTRNGELRQGWARLFNFSALFNMFWFTAFVLLPLSRRLAPMRRLYERWNVPVAPIGFGLLMVINYLALKVTNPLVQTELKPALTEIAEANFAIVFMLVAFALYACNAAPALARIRVPERFGLGREERRHEHRMGPARR